MEDQKPNPLGLGVKKPSRPRENRRDAEDSLRAAIASDPNNAEALCELAELQFGDGRVIRAMRNLRKSLAADPNHTQSFLVMARIHQRRGEEAEAQKFLEEALRMPSATPRQLREVAARSLAIGSLSTALDAYGKMIASDPTKDSLWRELAEVLRLVQVTAYDANFECLLLDCMNRTDLDYQDLAVCVMSLLKTKDRLAPFFALGAFRGSTANFDTDLVDALQDKLLLSLLEKAIAADAEIESALTALRYALLRCCLDPQSHDMAWGSLEPFAIALAHQCFLNEYVFSVSQDEEGLLDRAWAGFAEAELTPIARVMLATVACYRPFHRIESIEGILAKIADGNALNLQHLARLQWREPLLENKLRGTVPVLTAITDATSQAVRSFYEETPYPRWTSVKKIQPMDASTFLQGLFPSKCDLFTSFAEAPRVLVAGCGSGRHAILTAQLYAGSDVTAVDLSLASLAYAIRKAQELSIENLHFAQADLLSLDEGIGSFDIIECSGVLVCIEDPLDGLRCLAERLRPGGVMKIALYSEAARQHVVRARSFIQERGYDATPQGIRECRQAIMASDDSLLREISSGRDFFSMSMVRDLIFHIKEHRFTLGWIEAALAELELAVLGFEIADPVARKRYRHLKPSDMDFCDFEALGQLEAAYPDTFSEMYQFWVCRLKN